MGLSHFRFEGPGHVPRLSVMASRELNHTGLVATPPGAIKRIRRTFIHCTGFVDGPIPPDSWGRDMSMGWRTGRALQIDEERNRPMGETP